MPEIDGGGREYGAFNGLVSDNCDSWCGECDMESIVRDGGDK